MFIFRKCSILDLLFSASCFIVAHPTPAGLGVETDRGGVTGPAFAELLLLDLVHDSTPVPETSTLVDIASVLDNDEVLTRDMGTSSEGEGG